MKKILSDTKTLAILLVLAVLLLGFYVYLLARPISYGMSYHNRTVYSGELYDGTLTFRPDGTMTTRNTTFDTETEFRYYYKNGYLFSLMATTEETARAEIAYIDESFEEAVAMPFYAAKVNVFQYVTEGVDGYSMVYTCSTAIVFAVAAGLFELLLWGLVVTSVICRRKKPEKAAAPFEFFD